MYKIIRFSAMFSTLVSVSLFAVFGIWKAVTRKYHPDSIIIPERSWWLIFWLTTFVWAVAASLTGVSYRDLFRP